MMVLLKYLRKDPVEETSGARDDAALPTLDMCKTLTEAQLKEANKAVGDESGERNKKGKYNQYTEEDRAKIGKYTAENGPTRAASYFSAHLKCNVRVITFYL